MKKIIILALTLLAFTEITFARGGGDMPSVHGMLLFGQDDLYVSHLPMFHSPHNYQIIAQVQLSKEARSIYLKSKSNDPIEAIYTIVPESFVLPDVMVSGGKFKVTIFKGHFERGGSPISGEVEVNVSNVVYFNKLKMNSSPAEDLTYIYFGNKVEVFAAHIIKSKPDFDQIVEVKAPKEIVKHLKINNFLRVIISTDNNDLPLGEGILSDAYISSPKGLTLLSPHLVLESIYTEFGDLSF